jgi:GNAT superfamily N-acetyltransferase
VIRVATVGDVEAIAAVQDRSWRRAYADLLEPQTFDEVEEVRIARWREFLGGEGRAWVMEVEGRIVGFAGVCGRELRSLYVDPAAQGAGVGTALLAQAEAAGACELGVFEGNGHGRAFYEARGWRDAGPAGEWLGRPLRRYVR